MDARTQRTLLRLVALLLILGVAIVMVTFVHNDDFRVLGVGLATAAVLSIEEWIRNSRDTTASPTVAGVNAALQANASLVARPSVSPTSGLIVGDHPRQDVPTTPLHD